MSKAGRIAKKSGSILLYVVLGLLALVFLFYFFINTNPGKNVVRTQVENYLERKLKTKVEIGEVDYSLPKWLELKNVYFEDQNKDTLFFGRELSVDLNMIKLLGGNTDIQKVYLNNIFANIRRAENDSVFNFQFIVDAFTGNKASTTIKDTAELKLTLDHLIFDTVAMRFDDKNAGTKFFAKIQNLDAHLYRFQPDKLNFGIDTFYVKGIHFDMLSYKPSAPDTAVKLLTDSALAETNFGLYIKAKQFRLKDIYVNVSNSVNNMLYTNDVKNLYLTDATYNLVQNVILADTALLDSSSIKFVQPKPNPVNKNLEQAAAAASQTYPLYVKAAKLKIKDVNFKYDDLAKKPQQGFDAAHIDAKNIKLDVTNFLLSQDSTTAFVGQLAFRDKSGFAIDSSTIDILFTDSLLRSNATYIRTPNSLITGNFDIRYDSVAAISKDPGKTLLNAKFNNSLIAFNDLYTLLPFLKQSFAPAQFGGNKIRLNTELRGTMQRVYLPYLQMTGLSGSTIAATGTLYNLTDAKKFSYDLHILNSRLLKSDLLKFVPKENQASLANIPSVITLSGHLKGNTQNLVANIKATSQGFNYAGNIVLNNISDPQRLTYGLDFNNVALSKTFIESYLNPELRQTINLPDRIAAKGKFNGNINDFDADLNLATSYGNAKFKGFMKGFKNPQTANYNFEITTPGLDIGKLLRNDSLGTMNGFVAMKGNGFDYKTMNSDIVARLKSIYFNGYTYQNINAYVKMRRGSADVKGNIDDPSLRSNFDFVANVAKQYPTIIGYIGIDTAMLGRLGFVQDTLNLSSYLHLQAHSTTPRNLDFKIWTDSIAMQSGKEIYFLDTVALTGFSQNGVDDITLKSPFAFVNANGAFDYDKVAPSIIQYINHYYKIAPEQKVTSFKDQQLKLSAAIYKHPLLFAFVPGLQDVDSIKLNGSYASSLGDSALNLHATVPYILYNGNTLRSGEIKVNAKDDRLNYNIEFDTLWAGGRQFFGSVIKGAAAKDSISFNATTQDNLANNWFGASADYYLAQDGNFNFRLKDSLLLNYEKWNVAPDNLVSFGKRGVLVQNFRINSDTSIIELNSEPHVYDAPVQINVDNFDLESVMSFLNKDTLMLGGVMDVNMKVSDFDKELPSFTGQAQITDLQVYEQPLGTLALSTEKQNDQLITGRMNLNGYGNLINADGSYYLNEPNNQFDVNVDIKSLQFLTLQGLSQGQLKDASGTLYGQMKLNGKFSDPKWNGEIGFDTTRFTVTQLGAPYLIDKQKINFAYPNINFRNFTVKDSLGHDFVLNGNIKARSLSAYDFNLRAKTDDFEVMNTNRAIAETLYGQASIDADMSILGTTEEPDLQGVVRINRNSDVKLQIPDRNYAKDAGLDVVKFIDTDTFDVYHPPAPFVEQQAERAQFARFLNYNLNVEVDKDARLTIIVDPTTGDALKVQGEALLNAGVDPGGNLILGGNYFLEKGEYELSYQFLKRKFLLEKGSSITFVGQPMDARVNITASYMVNTSSKNLIGNQITENTSQLNQQIPFKVNLYITGPLSKPEIKFNINLVEDGTALINSDLRTTIQTKLAQISTDEAAMNKQVFSLLLMGRFVNEQSSDFFAGNGAGGFTDVARQSVTQFLSEALDQIAADLIKGVDIDLTLNSYRDFSASETGNQRTDLNITVSKSFMDDRLTLSIGNNFGLEGQDAVSRANAGNNTSAFNPNISATYKLTKDGKYLLRAYRKNQFEVMAEGYVVETGLSFILVMDFNKFGELFGKKN